MGYRELGNIDERILTTIIQMGAREGVENVSSKKVAKELGISSGTIFNKFPTMRDALDAAAQSFDGPRRENVLRMAQERMALDQIYDGMLDYLLADPSGTLYYISYTNFFGSAGKDRESPTDDAVDLARSVFADQAKGLTDSQVLLLWDYVNSMAMDYARKFLNGYLPQNSDTRTFIHRMVFDGARHLTQLCPQ